MDVDRLPRVRPPCSNGERAAAAHLAGALRRLGLAVRVERFRAVTSPAWPDLAAAVVRLAAAIALVTASPPVGVAVAATGLALTLAPRHLGRAFARLPVLGGTSVNVSTRVTGRAGGGGPAAPPLLVVAHLDNRPGGGRPLAAGHRALAAAAAGVAVAWGAVAAVGGSPGTWIAAAAGTEALVTIAGLARWELRRPAAAQPDDNASGVSALVRLGELLTHARPRREVWLVGTGAATSFSTGVRALLRAHRSVARIAWLVELDALGAAEIVVRPARRRIPRTTTPAAVLRAAAGAAIDTGDVIPIRRVRASHSDAEVALRRGVAAFTLTAGPPVDATAGPDAANIERAATIVDALARQGP